MPENQTSETGIASLISKGFLAACGIIISLCGLVVGLWSHGIEKDLRDIRDAQQAIWQVLNDRADLKPRVAELEKRDGDKEDRLRAVEKHSYTNGRK